VAGIKRRVLRDQCPASIAQGVAEQARQSRDSASQRGKETQKAVLAAEMA
jgi:hypothetical protein